MGFGSYDESEQKNQDVNTGEEDGEGVNVHENDHKGELTFESDASTTDLVDRLQEMKTGDEDEE